MRFGHPKTIDFAAIVKRIDPVNKPCQPFYLARSMLFLQKGTSGDPCDGFSGPVWFIAHFIRTCLVRRRRRLRLRARKYTERMRDADPVSRKKLSPNP
jgi:hypothetical protein